MFGAGRMNSSLRIWMRKALIESRMLFVQEGLSKVERSKKDEVVLGDETEPISTSNLLWSVL